MKNDNDTNQPNEYPRPKKHPEDLPWPPDYEEYVLFSEPACRNDEVSLQPFNEEIARKAFGGQYIDHLRKVTQQDFTGDWWWLAFVLRAVKAARETKNTGPDRLSVLKFELSISTKTQRVHTYIHLEHADLRSAHLERACLRSAHLEHANLVGAHLEHANLRSARLEHADLQAAHLEHANLEIAHLEHAYLVRAHLEHARFRDAHLEHAYLLCAHLEHADLVGAHLEHASFTSTHLEHADLSYAHLEHADLNFSYMTDCQLKLATLDNASARGLKGVSLFNDNAVKRLDIEGESRDPWWVLRRKYTGPWYLVNLGLLLIFLLPYLGQAAYLTAVAAGYDAVRVAEKEITPEDETVKDESVEYDAAIQVIAEEDGRHMGNMESIKETLDAAFTERTIKLRNEFDATHDNVPAWWVIAGGTQPVWPWWYVAATIVMACYNICRAYLTMQVSILRDQEERVWRTPTLEEYYGLCHPLSEKPSWRAIPRVMFSEASHWVEEKRFSEIWRLNPLRVIGLWRIHQIVRWILWFAVASFLFHMGSWLIWTQVPVPIVP